MTSDCDPDQIRSRSVKCALSGLLLPVLLLHVSRHYKQAYIHLLELRLVDNNLLEAKTIAGFVNYKACCFLSLTCTRCDVMMVCVSNERLFLTDYRPNHVIVIINKHQFVYILLPTGLPS